MVRPSVRNAALGLIGGIPLIGDGIVRSIEDHWPSAREREQAALISRQMTLLEKQAARIAELEARVARSNSLAGAQDRQEQDRILKSLGGSRRD